MYLLIFTLGLGAVVVFFIVNLLKTTVDTDRCGSLDKFLGSTTSVFDEASLALNTPSSNLPIKVYNDPGKQILVLFATEYGFSEDVAKKLHDKLSTELDPEFQVRIARLAWHKSLPIDLTQEQAVLIVCSTTGDGVPPTESREFFDEFLADASKNLESVNVSILALGDSNYPHFCKAGRSLSEQFEQKGAKKLGKGRVDVDQEDWTLINSWFEDVKSSLIQIKDQIQTKQDYIVTYDNCSSSHSTSLYNRNNPYWAKIVNKFDLTETKSEAEKYERQVVHIDLEIKTEPNKDSSDPNKEVSLLPYHAGDAVGIYPQNYPVEINHLIQVLVDGLDETREDLIGFPVTLGSGNIYDLALHHSGSHQTYKKESMPLDVALNFFLDLKSVKPSLLTALLQTVTDAKEKQHLTDLLSAGASVASNPKLKSYLEDGREVSDVLYDFKSGIKGLGLHGIVKEVRALQPRYYSIASSPKYGDNKISVCAAIVRYRTLGKERTGVCTTFLSDRITVGQTLPCFISSNPDFRLPVDKEVPIVMVGPGTGIAPFRAFMQERVKENAGETWLYFGCRNKDSDYLYKKEWEKLAEEGRLKLRTAFSRDQAEKVYVQHRIKEDGKDLWELIDKKGAHFYVCGDAKRMAGDVEQTLINIVMENSGVDEAAAKQYITNLEKQKRYQRDVWV
eukprot:TRINITY_DN5004_c0_g1_i1.p1 TRINITY_DN5004_c0_g1~~TRINITY_DN5004_c0_g1_i1.p1  ORF type:complete len:675 (-),score=177.69 TRINITY_DN5004_c0_g1_i1:52-2076(-)